MNNDQRDELETGKPSEVAKVLHGDKANPEVFEQPEAVELTTGTLVATEQAPTSDNSDDGNIAARKPQTPFAK